MDKQIFLQLLKNPAKIIVFVLYLVCSLVFGEFHPFSKFPIYSSFPNWSYCFFIQNTKGDTLFWDKELGTYEASVSHMYSSICQYENIKYGHGMESAEELEIVGNLIMNQVIENQPKSLKMDTLYLWRKHFSVHSGSIHEESALILKYNVE